MKPIKTADGATVMFEETRDGVRAWVEAMPGVSALGRNQADALKGVARALADRARGRRGRR